MIKLIHGLQIVSALFTVILVLLHSPKGDCASTLGCASQLFSSQKSTEKGLNRLTYFFVGIFIISTFLLGFVLK